jgi:hypothetical protein
VIHKRVTAHIKTSVPANVAGYQASIGSYPGTPPPASTRVVQNPNIDDQAMVDGALSANTLPNY